MKTVNIREVQHHFSKVLAWVESGEEVRITRRSKTVARLVPDSETKEAALPDFAARALAIWGETSSVTPLSEDVIRDREERT
ncbi:MAG TPA: type II toxin-antitoxin system prevent-host-death family antitoxin [Chthoniobacterales bacterium]